MQLDLLIFGILAGFLIYRLYGVVGTRHDDDRARGNPFIPGDTRQRPAVARVIDAKPLPATLPSPLNFKDVVDSDSDKDGRIETGLVEIAAADPSFDAQSFIRGARAAFEMIVTAFARGDRAALKPLLSPKLYADFSAAIESRARAGHIFELTLHRIKAARITEAHLGGVMAYITVDYDVEETSITRDETGAIVNGSPDHIITVRDLWTFTRDIRASDPNWILIETRAAA